MFLLILDQITEISTRLNSSQHHLDELKRSAAGQSHDQMMSEKLYEDVTVALFFILSDQTGQLKSAERQGEVLQTESTSETHLKVDLKSLV